MEQTLLFDGHKGHAISCIAWAEDGKKVFSADDAGIVVVTSIDFTHVSKIAIVFGSFGQFMILTKRIYLLSLLHNINLSR